MPNEPFFSYIMARKSCFQWNDVDIRFALDQYHWTFILLAH